MRRTAIVICQAYRAANEVAAAFCGAEMRLLFAILAEGVRRFEGFVDKFTGLATWTVAEQNAKRMSVRDPSARFACCLAATSRHGSGR